MIPDLDIYRSAQALIKHHGQDAPIQAAIPTSVSGEQTVELDTVKKRLEILLDKFEEIQGISLMQARKAMTRENEKAVQKGDTTFFRFRYPIAVGSHCFGMVP